MSKLYNFERYGMRNADSGEIDYDQVRAMAHKHKPKIILAGFSAYPRELDYKKFVEIADEVGAITMADIAHLAGLIAGKQLANPIDAGFNIVTTTTHKTLRGPRGGMILSQGKVGNPLKKIDKTVENLPTLIDRQVFPGFQGGPHMNNILAKAVAFGEALDPSFEEYARQTIANAKRLAEELSKRGFRLITGGTDNHLILADVHTSFGIDGHEAETVLDSIGLTLNKNAIPFDELPPFRPSGIRLGTPAITTRGMKEDQMKIVAEWVELAIKNRNDQKKLDSIRGEVVELCSEFKLP